MRKFTDAIQQEPDRDELRLIYGDYLIEQNDPLGELIVVQCRLAQSADHAEQRKMTVRQNQLLKARAKAWGDDWKFTQGILEYTELIAYSVYRDKEVMRCRFARGFIDHIDSHANVLQRRVDWVTEQAPLLTSLRIRDYRGADGPTPKMLTLLERVPHLRALALSPGNHKTIRAVSTRKHFANLRELSLEGGFERVSHEELELLAQSTVLESLEALDLYRQGLTDVGPLAETRFSLQKLLLNDNELGAAGARLLASTRAVRGLEELGLYNNGLEAAGVAALAQSPNLGRLVSLDLRSNRIRTDGAKALGSAKGLKALQKLTLVGNSLNAEAVTALCGPGLPALADLNLQHTRLSDDCVDALLAAKTACSRLTSLNLRSNKLTNQSAKRLAGCASLTGLGELNLNGNKAINATGIAALKKSRHLGNAAIYVGGKRLAR